MEYFLVIVSQIFKDKEYMFPDPAFIYDKICSIKKKNCCYKPLLSHLSFPY